MEHCAVVISHLREQYVYASWIIGYDVVIMDLVVGKEINIVLYCGLQYDTIIQSDIVLHVQYMFRDVVVELLLSQFRELFRFMMPYCKSGTESLVLFTGSFHDGST